MCLCGPSPPCVRLRGTGSWYLGHAFCQGRSRPELDLVPGAGSTVKASAIGSPVTRQVPQQSRGEHVHVCP